MCPPPAGSVNSDSCSELSNTSGTLDTPGPPNNIVVSLQHSHRTGNLRANNCQLLPVSHPVPPITNALCPGPGFVCYILLLACTSVTAAEQYVHHFCLFVSAFMKHVVISISYYIGNELD